MGRLLPGRGWTGLRISGAAPPVRVGGSEVVRRWGLVVGECVEVATDSKASAASAGRQWWEPGRRGTSRTEAAATAAAVLSGCATGRVRREWVLSGKDDASCIVFRVP